MSHVPTVLKSDRSVFDKMLPVDDNVSDRCHCVVSLSKNINSSLVLVQPRKTRPFITEGLLMGRQESNQTNKTLSLAWSLGRCLNSFLKIEQLLMHLIPILEHSF